MIEGLYNQFLVQHCQDVSPEAVRRLTAKLAGYLCHVTRVIPMMRYAKGLGLDLPFRELRKKIDGNPYTSSRLWRAVWGVLSGKPHRRTTRRYEVDSNDVDWLLSVLPIKSLRKIVERAAGGFREPYPDLERTILSMRPYCRQWINSNMPFLRSYDPSLSIEDFENDMMAAALRSAYMSDGRAESLTHLRNIAWNSAKNSAVSIIKHHQTKGRRRLIHTKRPVMQSTVRLFSRTHCWRCKEPSEEALCGPCTTQIMSSEIKGMKWSTKRESPEAFMGYSAEIIIDSGAQQWEDEYHRTTTSLDAAIPHQDDDLTLFDLLHDSPSPLESQQTADLIRDLTKQSQPIQHVCAVVLGLEDPAFEGWLAARYGVSTQDLKDKRLVHEACTFFGVTQRRLRKTLAPILGVENHAP